MPNRKLGIAAAVMALSLLPGLALADIKVSLKLQGGWAYLQTGDVNPGTQAFFDWGKIYFAPPSGGLIEGGYTAIHRGYEFGGDLIFELNSNIGIGIGAGYLQMSRNPPHFMMSIIDDPQGGGGATKYFTAGTKLNAIPIRVGLFLSLPASRKIDFTAHAGISYYLKAEYHADWYAAVMGQIPENPSQRLSTTAEKRTAPIGFQGGVGIEYNLIHSVAFFIEAQGRYARFRGFEGTSASEPSEWGGVLPSFSERGKLYYESVPMLPDAPRLIMVQSAPPAGPGGQPREAVVDFSGVSLQAGIRIHF
jgi:opacity protein-like surface antigen